MNFVSPPTLRRCDFMKFIEEASLKNNEGPRLPFAYAAVDEFCFIPTEQARAVNCGRPHSVIYEKIMSLRKGQSSR